MGYRSSNFCSLIIPYVLIYYIVCFYFATLRYVKFLTWQNPEQLFVAQVLIKNIKL